MTAEIVITRDVTLNIVTKKLCSPCVFKTKINTLKVINKFAVPPPILFVSKLISALSIYLFHNLLYR